VLRDPCAIFEKEACKRRIAHNGRLARRYRLRTPENTARLRVCMGEVPKTVGSTARRGGESKPEGTTVTVLLQERHALPHVAGSRQAALLVNLCAWREGQD
jgi:hypothetical protein